MSVSFQVIDGVEFLVHPINGSKDVVVRPATEADKERFHSEYAEFKAPPAPAPESEVVEALEATEPPKEEKPEETEPKEDDFASREMGE